MKKALLSFLVITTSVMILNAADTTFTEIWAHYGENAPAWFTDGSEATAEGGDNSFSGVERGIVYSPSENHVYVSSRRAEDVDDDGIPDWGEPHVFILDPMTGLAPSSGQDRLLTMGITSDNPDGFGGGYPLNNVTVSDDGSIFACNMTLAAGPDITTADGVTIKAFRVYRWDWELGPPALIIDYKESGYRLGDKFSVIGDWSTEAWIYAGAAETTKLLRWKVSDGIVDEEPTVITMQDIEGAGTSITVAPSRKKDDWIYVSGKGFMPTLFTTEGVNLTQVAINTAGMPSMLAGRTISYMGKEYMAMFAGDQRAFVFEISKHGENVTDADIIGFTPAFGTRFDNAYGEGAVEFGIIDEKLHVFVCAPSNGIAAYRINGLESTAVKPVYTDAFQSTAYPNPASDYANISFTLPKDARGAVAVKLFDMSGRFMGITADEARGGEQEIQVNTSELNSGQYVYQVVYKNEINTGKLIIK